MTTPTPNPRSNPYYNISDQNGQIQIEVYEAINTMAFYLGIVSGMRPDGLNLINLLLCALECSHALFYAFSKEITPYDLSVMEILDLDPEYFDDNAMDIVDQMEYIRSRVLIPHPDPDQPIAFEEILQNIKELIDQRLETGTWFELPEHPPLEHFIRILYNIRFHAGTLTPDTLSGSQTAPDPYLAPYKNLNLNFNDLDEDQ